MKNNIIYDKSFAFSIRVVRLVQFLQGEKKEFTMSKQVLKSGTSIGANLAEAKNAQSKADFASKINIALKETSETIYWLRLLEATDYLNQKEALSLLNDCIELEKILVSILKTLKMNAE